MCICVNSVHIYKNYCSIHNGEPAAPEPNGDPDRVADAK